MHINYLYWLLSLIKKLIIWFHTVHNEIFERNAAVSCSHLSSQSQKDEHEEEKQRPQRRDWKQSEGFWVGHKGQPRAVVSHLWHGDVEVVCHEAQDGENDKASINAGGTVGYTDDDAVSVCWKEQRTKPIIWIHTEHILNG